MGLGGVLMFTMDSAAIIQKYGYNGAGADPTLGVF
jgi:hypothetical protein